MSPEIGRVVLVVGLVIAAIGLVAALGIRIPFGRLPGDISISGDRGGVFIPITSMVIVSIILTVLANLIWRR